MLVQMVTDTQIILTALSSTNLSLDSVKSWVVQLSHAVDGEPLRPPKIDIFFNLPWEAVPGSCHVFGIIPSNKEEKIKN